MNNYKTFPLLLLIMGTLIYNLNYCTNIAACAFAFTSLVFTANIMSKTYGTKKSILALSAASFANLILSINTEYTINGRIFDYIIQVSIVAAFLSSILSIASAKLFNQEISFVKTNILGVLIASIADAVFMSVYFVFYLHPSTVLAIGLKEIVFKIVFSILFSVLVRSIVLFANKKHQANISYKA